MQKNIWSNISTSPHGQVVERKYYPCFLPLAYKLQLNTKEVVSTNQTVGSQRQCTNRPIFIPLAEFTIETYMQLESLLLFIDTENYVNALIDLHPLLPHARIQLFLLATDEYISTHPELAAVLAKYPQTNLYCISLPNSLTEDLPKLIDLCQPLNSPFRIIANYNRKLCRYRYHFSQGNILLYLIAHYEWLIFNLNQPQMAQYIKQQNISYQTWYKE